MAHDAPSASPERRSLPRLFLRVGGAAAVAVLLFELPGGNPFPRVKSSLATLRQTAALALRGRRMAGRGPAIDRRFFELVLAAREALPAGTKGVVLVAPDVPEWGGRFLAIYELAPIPVVDGPARPQSGWVTLIYGRQWPPGWKLLRSLPGGALLEPS